MLNGLFVLGTRAAKQQYEVAHDEDQKARISCPPEVVCRFFCVVAMYVYHPCCVPTSTIAFCYVHRQLLQLILSLSCDFAMRHSCHPVCVYVNTMERTKLHLKRLGLLQVCMFEFKCSVLRMTDSLLVCE